MTADPRMTEPSVQAVERVLDRDACRGCGREIVQVDLTGTPFFTHKPRRDCLTWWHVDRNRSNHQARPMGSQR